MQRFLYILVVVFLLFGITKNGYTQQSDNASANASAIILAQLEVLKVTDLLFGDVSPGINKTIARTNGAEFTVTGGSGASVSLDFTLPAGTGYSYSLVDANENELELVFAAEDANWETGTTTNDAGSNTFDPTAGATTISGFPAGGIAVFLGGTVIPTNDQPAGEYEGTITLTAIYN